MSSEDDSTIRIRLTPKGGRDALIKREAAILHARVAAPPVDGAANRALIALLSKSLGIARSRFTIVSGESSREKLLRIEGITPADLNVRLEKTLKI